MSVMKYSRKVLEIYPTACEHGRTSVLQAILSANEHTIRHWIEMCLFKEDKRKLFAGTGVKY